MATPEAISGDADVSRVQHVGRVGCSVTVVGVGGYGNLMTISTTVTEE